MKIYNEKLRENHKGNREMEDVVLAKGLIRDIGGTGKVYAVIGNACDYLQKLFPHANEPRKQWTERRLWAWWSNQSDTVRHWQMVELYKASAKAKEERVLIAAARKEHAEFLRKTASIAALLERQDADFNGPQIAALRDQMGRMDRSRNQGD